jgi:hypothetical protein
MGLDFPIYPEINPIIPVLLITFLKSYRLKVFPSSRLPVFPSSRPLVLLHRDGLRQVPRLIDIAASQHSDVIR